MKTKNANEIAKFDRQLDRLHDAEYAAGRSLELLSEHEHVEFESSLHLAVSMRSFRAENLAKFVHKLLDRDVEGAREAYQTPDEYPIVLTRSLEKAKRWLKEHARGTERYGMIISSQHERLKPLAIDVRFKPDVVHWFLDDATDVRSCWYAPYCETPTQKIQISTRGSGSRTRNYYDSMRDVESK